ncbi:MAG: ABC transporter substrate-binding protein [Candidatus Bathyarchaeia archaeon]
MASRSGISGTVAAILLIAVLVIGIGGGYWFGSSAGYSKGYDEGYEAGVEAGVELGKEAERKAVPNPDTLIVQTFGEPDFLDPAVDYETAGNEIIRNLYNNLVTYVGESSSELKGDLAESWTISDDGLTYTFKLKEGVKFHDGNEVTAEDVKYSIDRAILIGDPDGPAWMLEYIKGAAHYMFETNMTQADADEYLAQEGVKVLDKYTVQISLDEPYAGFIYVLAYQVACVVSKATVEAHGGLVPGEHNEWMDFKGDAGSGPYKLTEWVPKQRVVIERFDDYFEGPASIKNVVWQIVPEVTTRELALFAGDADIIEVPFTNAFDIIQKDPWLENREMVLLEDLPAVLYVDVVPQLTVHHIQMNAEQPPLDDIRVRKALIYAFPYETFIKQALNGFGFRRKTVIPKGLFGYDDTMPLVEEDAAKAKQLFEEAGFKGKITYVYNIGNDVRKLAGLLLKDAVEKLDVGVEIEVQELDWPTMLGKLRKKDYQLMMIGWAPDYADPDNYVTPYCHSKKGTFLKRMGYSDPELDALVEQAATEVDPTTRANLYKQIERRMADGYMYIWMYQGELFFVSRDWIKGDFGPTFNPMAAGMVYAYTLTKGYE